MMIKMLISVIIAIFLALFAFNLYSVKCRPTLYWFVRVFYLHKIFPKKFEDIRSEPIGKVEALLHFLIINRCCNENRVIAEVRNNYVINYYPEGCLRNKRIYSFSYCEIYDEYTQVLLRVGFDNLDMPKYQIAYFCRKKEAVSKMYSKMYNSKKVNFTDSELKDIVSKYRDYVIRHVL